jgi:hypothetical protein
VLPKPSVSPCTEPNTRLTLAVPITTPVATGRKAMTSARGDANASSSSPPITMPPTTARWMASDLILSRLITENTGGPLSSSLGAEAPMSRVAASKAACTRAMATACASRSPPAARVVEIMSARGAVRDIHTPSSLRGALAGTSSMAMRCVSPVGSRSSKGLIALPAGVPSIDSVSLMASRSPSAVNWPGVTPGDSW